MNELKEKYRLSWWELILCCFAKKFKKSNRVPKLICKLSRKRYGWKDNLKRYYIEKYFDLKIGRYTYGYEAIGLDFF